MSSLHSPEPRIETNLVQFPTVKKPTATTIISDLKIITFSVVLGNSVSGRDDGNIGHPAGTGLWNTPFFSRRPRGPSALTFRIYAPYILFYLRTFVVNAKHDHLETLSSTGRNREVSSAYIELENIFDLTIQFQIFLCGRGIIHSRLGTTILQRSSY